MYKVIVDSEEATLEIRRTKKDTKIGPLLGTNNKHVSEKLRIIVSNWFRESSRFYNLIIRISQTEGLS